MRKLIILISCSLLAACGKTSSGGIGVHSASDIVIDGKSIGSAPPPKMPALPSSLAKKADPLPPLTDRSVAGQQKDAIATDRKYNDVAYQLNNVIDAWGCVMEALNNQKSAKACFEEKKK